MGESFKNFIVSSLEKKPELIFKSETVATQRFEETKAERPKSAELQNAHPELYDFLMKNENAKHFNVGIIHIDGVGAVSKKLAAEGNTPLGIRNTLKDLVKRDLEKLAKTMKESPDSEIGKTEFFTAYSKLANQEGIAKDLGFEIFNIDEDYYSNMNKEDKKEWDKDTNKQIERTYNAMNKIKPISRENIEKLLNKRAPKIALISKQALFNLLEKSN